MSVSASPRHRVVIVGGGFGGMLAALGLRKAQCDVTLIDRRNFHLFQPLLYQVATGSLSPGEIAAPLRALLRKQSNVRVLLAEAIDVDVTNRRVADSKLRKKDSDPQGIGPGLVAGPTRECSYVDRRPRVGGIAYLRVQATLGDRRQAATPRALGHLQGWCAVGASGGLRDRRVRHDHPGG